MNPVRIDLPWARPPLSLNDRGSHWAVKARKVAEVRQATAWLVRQARLGRFERVRIELHYRPRVMRVHDADNLIATYKPLVDGAVTDAGLAADDSDRHVQRVWPVIYDPVAGRSGRMWMVVRESDRDWADELIADDLLVARINDQLAATYGECEDGVPGADQVIAEALELVAGDAADRAADLSGCVKVDTCAAKAVVLRRVLELLGAAS